jgi:hypothetical protein
VKSVQKQNVILHSTDSNHYQYWRLRWKPKGFLVSFHSTVTTEKMIINGGPLSTQYQQMHDQHSPLIILQFLTNVEWLCVRDKVTNGEMDNWDKRKLPKKSIWTTCHRTICTQTTRHTKVPNIYIYIYVWPPLRAEHRRSRRNWGLPGRISLG